MALFVFLKIGQKGVKMLGFFRKKKLFCQMLYMGYIYKGNLILRTMIFEYFINYGSFILKVMGVF